MPTVPAGATITAATMKLTMVSGTSLAYTANAYQVTGGEWDPTTIQWTNKPAANILLESNISNNDRTKYQFSVLTAVQHWYDGDPTGQNENYGIMLRYYDETLTGYYNSVYSGDVVDTNSRPKLTITYRPGAELDVDVGATRELYVSGTAETVTWESEDPSVATVDANGVVTGIKAGFAVINAYVGGEMYSEFTIWVTVPDGVYYIEYRTTNLFIGIGGGVSEHTPLQLVTSASGFFENILRMWRITYIGAGYYSIRPMQKLDMGVCAANGTQGNVELTSIGTTDTLMGVPNSNKWMIEYHSSGYIFYDGDATDIVMRCEAPYPTAGIVTANYTPEMGACYWNLTRIDSGLCLYNTFSNDPVPGTTTRYVIYNTPTTLANLCVKPFDFSTMSSNCDINWSVRDSTIASIDATSGTITGKKTGTTTVVGVLQSDSSQQVSFQLVVIGPEQYSVGVRTAMKNGVQYYDFTIPVNELFEDAVALCEDHRCMNWTQYCTWAYDISINYQLSLSEYKGMQLGSFLWFYQQVNHKAVWDIKRETQWKAALPSLPYLIDENGEFGAFVFRGAVTTAEGLGNIMYGYTGRATGFGEVTLYWGGGVAAQGSVDSDAVTQPPYYGDTEEDHDNIKLGFDMFNQDYPSYPDVGYDEIPLDDWLAAIADVILNPGT